MEVNTVKFTHNFLPQGLWEVHLLEKDEEGLKPSHENGLQIGFVIELELCYLIIQLILVENHGVFF